MAELITVSVSASMAAGYRGSTDIRGHQVVIDPPENAMGSDQGPAPLERFGFLN
tara:strand:+ start:126 stop:287 length:162 start_codon:yes stop_codon:yes gene_type:complete